MTKGQVLLPPGSPLRMNRRSQQPHRMRVIGFAPWKPLPPIIDDPDWDTETFAEQASRLGTLLDDDGANEAGM